MFLAIFQFWLKSGGLGEPTKKYSKPSARDAAINWMTSRADVRLRLLGIAKWGITSRWEHGALLIQKKKQNCEANSGSIFAPSEITPL